MILIFSSNTPYKIRKDTEKLNEFREIMTIIYDLKCPKIGCLLSSELTARLLAYFLLVLDFFGANMSSGTPYSSDNHLGGQYLSKSGDSPPNLSSNWLG